MSKIHDALKRAQQEKPAGFPALGQSDQRDVQVPPMPAQTRELVAVEMEQQVPPQGPSRGGVSGQYLRFDDLLKQCAQRVWQPDPSSIIFSDTRNPIQCAEQFRTLRSRLYQLRDTSPLRKVMVTSAIAGEGKTFVATNLAQAIAQERERKVLLIDGDLRNPRLHVPLGAPLSPGLSEYLRGEANEADVIQHGQEGNLCFIPGGHEVNNASELLLNGRLPKLLDRIAPLFDWVILDSPPSLPIADASVLASFADGVLLVVRACSTPSALAQRARKELQKRNVVGVVLNGIEDHPHGAYYGRDYGYVRDQEKNKRIQ
jgi:capsular exopolysaccharide synthesis family protein